MAFEFDRYINGELMAEGVTIERQDNLPDAMRAAARIASRGPNGEAPVLVLRAEALSRTGAVKVDRQRLNMEISKWATDSDLHITIGDVEALHLSILSALEPAAPEGEQEVEPVAFRVHDFHVARMPVKAKGKFPEPTEFLYPASRAQDAKETARIMGGECQPLFTRPAEQAVTEAMVETAISIMFHKHGWFPPRQVVKDALRAAMEAGG